MLQLQQSYIMSDKVKQIIFFTYYLFVIFFSTNNFSIQELQVIYDFLNDKDKMMHFIQYFILIILALFSFRVEPNLKNFMFLCLFAAISSATFELIQNYLSARDSSWMDCVYDIFGAISGFLVFKWLRKVC